MRFLDNTLRDGSHYNKHSFSPKQVSDIAAALDLIDLDVIEIGHGNIWGKFTSNRFITIFRY